MGSRKKKLYKSFLSRLFLLAEVLDSPVEWLRTVITFSFTWLGVRLKKNLKFTISRSVQGQEML